MRLISLCPSLTELLFDLGVGEAVVGRTKFCIHPEGMVERVERMGGTKNPKIDRIVERAPDIVFMNEEENRREDADALRARGIRVHASLPRTPEETAAMVRSIAAAVERNEAGDRIARQIEAGAARVRAASAEAGRRVTYAYLIWRDPWMTINDDTFVAEMLKLPGGANVFGTAAERYPSLTALELANARPDVVLLSTEPFPFAERHIDELAAATGLEREKFRIVDGELLSWHGSRTPLGIAYAEEVLASVAQRSVAPAADSRG
ncbi:MAG: helical backbone metal receptor [Gemmatimonadaceae bacterium]